MVSVGTLPDVLERLDRGCASVEGVYQHVRSPILQVMLLLNQHAK